MRLQVISAGLALLLAGCNGLGEGMASSNSVKVSIPLSNRPPRRIADQTPAVTAMNAAMTSAMSARRTVTGHDVEKIEEISRPLSDSPRSPVSRLLMECQYWLRKLSSRW